MGYVGARGRSTVALIGWAQRRGTQHLPRIGDLLGAAVAPTNLSEIQVFRCCVRQAASKQFP